MNNWQDAVLTSSFHNKDSENLRHNNIWANHASQLQT